MVSIQSVYKSISPKQMFSFKSPFRYITLLPPLFILYIFCLQYHSEIIKITENIKKSFFNADDCCTCGRVDLWCNLCPPLHGFSSYSTAIPTNALQIKLREPTVHAINRCERSSKPAFYCPLQSGAVKKTFLFLKIQILG